MNQEAQTNAQAGNYFLAQVTMASNDALFTSDKDELSKLRIAITQHLKCASLHFAAQFDALDNNHE